MSENMNNVPVETEEQDINVLKRVRLEKLADLKAADKNPYEITKYDVTAKNADLKAQYEKDEKAVLEAAGDDEEAVKVGLDKFKENISVLLAVS